MVRGSPGPRKLLPCGLIELWPGSRALQYAALVFEGLKTYGVGGMKAPNCFCAEENCRRLGCWRQLAKRLVGGAGAADGTKDCDTRQKPGRVKGYHPGQA